MCGPIGALAREQGLTLSGQADRAISGVILSFRLGAKSKLFAKYGVIRKNVLLDVTKTLTPRNNGEGKRKVAEANEANPLKKPCDSA
jgi:hypothetical protein